MPFVFELTDDIRLLAYQAQQDMLDALGKPIRLVFIGDDEPCQGCGLDTVSGKRPNVVPPGRTSVVNRDCPQCGGTGYRKTEIVETINGSINWSPHTFQTGQPPLDVRKPGGICEVKTIISLMPKLMKCEYAIINVPMENYAQYKFKLDGEPLDTSNITPLKFCFTVWKRI